MTDQFSNRRRLRLAACGLAMAFFASIWIAGCNIVGPAAYLIAGPPTVDPVYPMADVPTIVFVDDRSNVVNPISLRKVIADRVLEDLMMKKVLSQKNALSSSDAMALATQRERNNQILSVEEIGKAVGAKQVIYVKMEQFADTPDGFTPQPTAMGKVKLIDVESRKRLYPAEDALQSAHEVPATSRSVDPGLYSTRAGRLKVREELAIDMGRMIGRLFYKHEARPLGEKLTPR